MWMFITGLGIGPTFAVFTIVVQNAVPFNELGAATSDLTLFRQIGTTVGIAVAFTIFRLNFTWDLLREELVAAGAPPAARADDAATRLRRRRAHQRERHGRRGLPAQIPPAFQPIFVEGFHSALTISIANSIWIGVAAAAISLVTALFLKEIPLRTTNRAPATARRGRQALSRRRPGARPARTPRHGPLARRPPPTDRSRRFGCRGEFGLRSVGAREQPARRRLRVAADRPDSARPDRGRRGWGGVRAGLHVTELPAGGMRRVTWGDLDVLLVAPPIGLVAIDDRCPHMSAPLSLGTLDGCLLDCPLHNGQFDLATGDPTRMPTTGGLDADGNYHPVWSAPGSEPKPDPPGIKAEARRFTRVRRIRYYPVRVRDGIIEVAVPTT